MTAVCSRITPSRPVKGVLTTVRITHSDDDRREMPAASRQNAMEVSHTLGAGGAKVNFSGPHIDSGPACHTPHNTARNPRW